MTDILDTLDDLDDDDFEDYNEEEVYEGVIVESDDQFDLSEYEMNEEQAVEITNAIRSAATATFILLAEAHHHKAHKALGYETWADYVREEFDMTAQRSYQLLDLSKVTAVIEQSVPEGTVVKLTEAQARDIKRELPKITEKIKEETAGLSPEDAAERAQEILDEAREQAKADSKAVKEKETEIADAELDEHYAELESQADELLEADRPDGITDRADDGFIDLDIEGDGTEDGLSPEDTMNLYNFFNALTGIGSLPEPDHFIDSVPNSRSKEISEQLLSATAWLNRFQTLWEVRELEKEDS